MDLASLENFKENIYYRGLKQLYVVNITTDSISFSNKDKIKIEDNNIYLNNKLISNIPDITVNELVEMYIDILKRKGYKFL